jgi:transcriptional regulator with GAF, ATPase, and Fis domain
MACPIYVLDSVTSRRTRLIDELSPLLATAIVADSYRDYPALFTHSSQPSVALLGLNASAEDRELPAARALASSGLAVLVYADEWRNASLSRRCRALLAGVTDVHDAGDAQFTAALRVALLKAMQDCEEKRQEDRSIAASLEQLGIVGGGAPMMALGRWIQKVAPLSDLPVLITGETGTGKELVARAVHRLDPKRGRGPFVPLNCAALTSTLAESELFGHRKGAFTGATSDRRGLIRAAHGGTLFLDEIGELELSLQAKLLRVLQENRVRPVGDDHEDPVSVRVVAATNRDLHAMVEQGQFRRDLLYRLNLLTVRMPSLSERGDDIETLVAHFLKKYGAGPHVHIGATLIDAVKALHLPGNVRQLENLIRYAIVQANQGGTLGLEHLPSVVWDELSQAAPAAQAAAAEPSADRWTTVFDMNKGNLSRSVSTCERQLLQVAMSRAHGNRSAAARLLGITPRSVYNKLRKHRLAG